MTIRAARHRRIILAAMLSVAGAATAVAMFAGLRGAGSRILSGDEGWVIAAAAVGAFIAGLTTASGFGRRGWSGWMVAALASVAATMVGAMTGGILLFRGLNEGIYCVVTVIDSIVQFPVTGFTWLALMAAVQALALVLVPKVAADLDLVPGPDDL